MSQSERWAAEFCMSAGCPFLHGPYGTSGREARRHWSGFYFCPRALSEKFGERQSAAEKTSCISRENTVILDKDTTEGA